MESCTTGSAQGLLLRRNESAPPWLAPGKFQIPIIPVSQDLFGSMLTALYLTLCSLPERSRMYIHTVLPSTSAEMYPAFKEMHWRKPAWHHSGTWVPSAMI